MGSKGQVSNILFSLSVNIVRQFCDLTFEPRLKLNQYIGFTLSLSIL